MLGKLFKHGGMKVIIYTQAIRCSANIGPNDDVAIFFGLSGIFNQAILGAIETTLAGEEVSL